MSLIEWTISDADRASFVELSGDANPIHADPIEARRQFGGRLLVHGAHVVLATIDHALAQGVLASAPSRIVAAFHHGIAPDSPLTTRLTVDADGVVTAEVDDDVWHAATIAITPGGPPPSALAPDAVERLAGPRDWSPGDPVGRIGLTIDDDLASKLFPTASGVLGPTRLASIAGVSYAVGMLTPGRHSLSSHYAIVLSEPTSQAAGLMTVEVAEFDQRLHRLRLRLEAPGFEAEATAFQPPPPVDQAALLDSSTARSIVGEFAGWRVLVAGDADGLGHAARLLLARGGAEVLTSDADLSPPSGVTHLVWFASPPTATGVAGRYSSKHFDELLAVQVTAFERVVAGLATPPLRGVLWPSSDLLDKADPGDSEFVDVKLAGEAACKRIAGANPSLTVAAPRLPSMLTDATRSLLPRPYADTASTLLAALRMLS